MAAESPVPDARNNAAEKALTGQRKGLLNFIRKRVGTEEDAEDILQDVFYQLASSYNLAEPIEELTSWLYTVARNRIVDWYRKRNHRPPIPLDDETGLPINPEDVLSDPAEEPDEVYLRSLVWTELADALDELPEEQKEVFVMHEIEGRSFKEIAEITGESVNTLLSRKRYAVLALRESLQDLNNDI